jgi:hypothetical protein
MDCAPKSSLPTVLDPFAASVIAQLHEQIASKDQALHAAEEIIQQLKEALRLERIRQFGKQSEKLSDLRVSRTRARARGAVSKMEVGLPKPACRSRLQTARCCCAQKWRGGERPWKRHSVRMSGVY